MLPNGVKLTKEVKIYTAPCPKCSGESEVTVTILYGRYEHDVTSWGLTTCDECGYISRDSNEPDI